jgi:uncharacterized protein YutE (UPF0331/DUF86 family)
MSELTKIDDRLLAAADIEANTPIAAGRQIYADPELLSPKASESSLEKIAADLAYAERMTTAGDIRTSCVISWAALESALRHAARGAGVEVKSAAPGYLLRALCAKGILEQSEFDRLNEALRIRNSLVHGMSLPELDPGVARYVAGVTRRLLSENGQRAAS